ncbi:unnamed protein product [Acanthosepion pharaonis]|uniref:PARP catalytic domain-containing protein n=1 Tax=Acanthosepion pharaonis TaxID=158019 RepID=A0A812EA12_ACAPH|nr:unnamed protein product [Sepia pharaonis]
MISLGILDKNWARGLNEKEAEVKFNQILNSQNSATPTPKYVENEKQKKLFQEEINQVKRLHGNEFDLQIKELYHATKAPRNLICSRGLDQRLSTVGLFGRGIYFADDVRKCEQYLYNVKGSAIYKCSVILGDIKEYPDGKADPQLKQEPEKENGDYYDSVKGNMDGFNEYVIYDNRRCLINYRIVLEGTEDEDSDKEDEIAKAEKKEEFMETWKRHMNHLVDSCKHDDEEDAKVEQEIRNIEKIRLEIRMRREMKTGKPLTKLSYNLLREERKKWKSCISKAENKSVLKMKTDREHEIAEEEKKKEVMETWKRHMNYLVDSCKHDDEEDAEVEQEICKIQKIRLEVRMRREMKTGKPLTKLSYDLLREERKEWKSCISKAENKSIIPERR